MGSLNLSLYPLKPNKGTQDGSKLQHRRDYHRGKTAGSGVRLLWSLLGLSTCQLVGPLTFRDSALPSEKWGVHMLGSGDPQVRTQVFVTPRCLLSVILLWVWICMPMGGGASLKQTFKFYFFVHTKGICFSKLVNFKYRISKFWIENIKYILLVYVTYGNDLQIIPEYFCPLL